MSLAQSPISEPTVPDLDGISSPAMDWRAIEIAAPLSRFRCVGCGYGASCRAAPERCPMCGSHVWEYEDPTRNADRDEPLWREREL